MEQLLKGDPERRYKDAAFKLNLEKILNSGSAPQIELLPEAKTERAGDTVRVTVRISDTGGGIGEKVVWRVNGVTARRREKASAQLPASRAAATASSPRPCGSIRARTTSSR